MAPLKAKQYQHNSVSSASYAGIVCLALCAINNMARARKKKKAYQ